jgi:hypothetical protein
MFLNEPDEMIKNSYLNIASKQSAAALWVTWIATEV